MQAKVITVSNREGDIAQHATMESALSEAVDGDIIYVQGSPLSYQSFTINQRLTLIGSGHRPAGTDPFVSTLGEVVLDEGSSGTEIIGFNISSIRTVVLREVNNVVVKRNNISFGVGINFGSNSRNWKIEENIINRISSSSSGTSEEAHLIRNNIIFSFVSGVKFSTFAHNVFTFSSPIFSPQGVQSNNFVNNIFFQNNLLADFAANRIVGCTFNHNIFFGPNNPSSIPEGNANVGLNNIFANPQLVNVQNNSFNYGFDYGLSPGSPGINAGVDDVDIGLFGGIGFSVSGEPSIPQVTLFNILNPIVPQNGNLNIRIEGRANN